MSGREGLQSEERSVIDRCVRKIYLKYFEDPSPEKMPVLEDLYNELRSQKDEVAEHVATALEIYVKGSLSVFNHRTNVDINNRITCFDIKGLGKQLKKLGMLIVQDLLSSVEVENIFENSDFILMLNQAAGDREILAKKLGISPSQLSFVKQSGEGVGLLFYGGVILPFADRFPKDLELYRIMTTKLSEIQEAKEESSAG